MPDETPDRPSAGRSGDQPAKRRRKPIKYRKAVPEGVRDRAANGLVRSLTWLAGRLPYRQRVRFFGWASARLIGPLIRVPVAYRRTLSQMFPEMSPAEVAACADKVSNFSGRSVIEMYSGEEFLADARALELQGAGVEAVMQARENGQTAIFATAHYGSYNAARVALVANGFDLGLLYRPASNQLLNRHYVKALAAMGGKVFPRTQRGLAGMVRHLRAGKPLMVLFDLHVNNGASLRFFDRATMTSLSPAELALRHNALLVPFYGTRLEDGFTFRVEVDAPIPHSTPEAMMQALNHGLEARIRAHPEQWFYLHKRWKSHRKGQRPKGASAGNGTD